MTTHTIEIEGLPPGWEPVAFRVPLDTDQYWNGHNVCDGSYGNNGYGSIIVQKSKPRRIVLEETEEDNVMDGRFYKDQGFMQGKVLVVSQPKIWRIKEE